ncbi:MAG TPA: hypothetical protein VFN89_05000 [Solirubrobacterales bacterium]|nr:hypothetical protein [Solirubrobacterales bacterium]
MPDPKAQSPEELADEAVPIPDSPHVAHLRNSKGGPYYLAPDSAEPLPSGMWAELDPKAVEEEAERLNAEFEREHHSIAELPSEFRERLKAGGPAARSFLGALDPGALAPKR